MLPINIYYTFFSDEKMKIPQASKQVWKSFLLPPLKGSRAVPCLTGSLGLHQGEDFLLISKYVPLMGLGWYQTRFHVPRNQLFKEKCQARGHSSHLSDQRNKIQWRPLPSDVAIKYIEREITFSWIGQYWQRAKFENLGGISILGVH